MKRLIKKSENLNIDIYECANKFEQENNEIEQAVNHFTKLLSEDNFLGFKSVEQIEQKIIEFVVSNDDLYDKFYDYFLTEYNIDLSEDYDLEQELFKYMCNKADRFIDTDYIKNLL